MRCAVTPVQCMVEVRHKISLSFVFQFVYAGLSALLAASFGALNSSEV